MKEQFKRISKYVVHYGIATLLSAIALFLLNYTVSMGWNAITKKAEAYTSTKVEEKAEERRIETAVRQETLMPMPVPESIPSYRASLPEPESIPIYQAPQTAKQENSVPVVEEEQNIQGKVIDAFLDNTKGMRDSIDKNLNETVETFLGKTVFKEVVNAQKERKPEMPNQQFTPQANLRPIKPQEAVFDKHQNPDNCKRGYIRRSNSPDLIACF